jgi:hypothetical protein
MYISLVVMGLVPGLKNAMPNEPVEKPCFRMPPHQNPHRAIKAPLCSWNSTTAQKAFCKGSDAVLREFPFPSNHFVTD